MIIAVVNQKGGVAKTTTAVNTAAALANQGKKVLLVDFDPQGHSGDYIGVVSRENKNILDVLEKNTTPKAAWQPSYIKNLWVLPSNLNLGKYNQNSPVGRQFILRDVLTEDAVEFFDYIFIDCQPSLSLLTLNALTACDYVLLPVQAEFLALDGLSQLIITLKEIQTKLHPKLQVLGVVLTMFDRRNKLSYEVREELKKNFGSDMFETSIPRSVKLAESPSFSKAIFDYAPSSMGARAYYDLAIEIDEKIQAKEAVSHSPVVETTSVS
jgi:chromosome partitioning protein